MASNLFFKEYLFHILQNLIHDDYIDIGFEHLDSIKIETLLSYYATFSTDVLISHGVHGYLFFQLPHTAKSI